MNAETTSLTDEQISTAIKRIDSLAMDHGLSESQMPKAISIIRSLIDNYTSIHVPHMNVINNLTRARDGWKGECDSLKTRLHMAECELDVMYKHQKNDVWYWQGDGEDHLESMANRMAVLIYAGDLRAAIERAVLEAAPASSAMAMQEILRIAQMADAAMQGDSRHLRNMMEEIADALTSMLQLSQPSPVQPTPDSANSPAVPDTHLAIGGQS